MKLSEILITCLQLSITTLQPIIIINFITQILDFNISVFINIKYNILIQT